MSSIRERIDPDGTLPVVELDPYDVVSWGKEEYRESMDILVDASIGIDKTVSGSVGTCIIYTENYPTRNKAVFSNIDIDEDLHGRGIGLAVYAAAIDLAHQRGLSFETHGYNQTAKAKRIWEILAAKGVAEVIEPFRPSDTDFSDRFNGHYRVPVPTDAA